jgi:uracil-DNA glycosylase family protein
MSAPRKTARRAQRAPVTSSPARALARGESGASADTAAPLVPATRDLARLRAAAKQCLACPAGELGSQTVFGAGSRSARLFLAGEQPGHEEDLAGEPFVGPAGRLLDRALERAEIPRSACYVTNVVKHFSYVWRGKRRIHQKPSLRVVRACRPWLEAELAAVQPQVLVCLGGTAAQSLMGPRFGVIENRGRAFETPWAAALTVTYHPSAILRMKDEARKEGFAALVSDLKFAYKLAQKPAAE